MSKSGIIRPSIDVNLTEPVLNRLIQAITMENRRTTADHSSISASLVKKGESQLNAEILLIERWIDDLNGTSENNPEAISARKTYTDMLKSRQELLNTLQKNHPH